MTTPAPVVDGRLAELFAGEPNPKEELLGDQSLALTIALAGTADILTSHGRLAKLACGHFVITKALNRAGCPRCGEMIRSGYDYDAFRNRGGFDVFSWPGDPLRILHETDELTPRDTA